VKHIKQIEAFYDPARFKFVLAGRRGGKTFMIIEDILKSVCIMPEKSEMAYVGPTLEHAKELILNPLQDRLDEMGWPYDIHVSKHRFEFPGRKYLYMFGSDKTRRLRGRKLYRLYLDEIAFYERSLAEIWRAARPALSDQQGGAIVSTTPNGKGTDAYDFYLQALKSPTWNVFKWKTIDNPFIPKEEIDHAMRDLDEKSFKQEYEAEWESMETLAYYNFDEHLHIGNTDPVDTDIPLHLVFDFNVNPTTLLISQFQHGRLQYKKEYSFKNSSTEETIKAFCEDFNEYAHSLQIVIRGDASGKNRSASTGRSDYYYVTEVLHDYNFKYEFEVMSKNPPIVDRLKVVNGWLKPFKGDPRIVINPSCENLIRDLASQELRTNRMPSDHGGLIGHKSDAMGYDVYYQQRVTTHTTSEVIQL
jgi:PBSX family phage terminase large subunit